MFKLVRRSVLLSCRDVHILVNKKFWMSLKHIFHFNAMLYCITHIYRRKLMAWMQYSTLWSNADVVMALLCTLILPFQLKMQYKMHGVWFLTALAHILHDYDRQLITALTDDHTCCESYTRQPSKGTIEEINPIRYLPTWHKKTPALFPNAGFNRMRKYSVY